MTLDFVGALRADGAALAAAARQAGPDAPVPTCPEWTVRDLVTHTWQVHRHRVYVVGERLQQRPETGYRDASPPPAGTDVVGLFEEGVAQLADVLERTPPETRVWTWFPDDQTAGFWRRRMAHETAVHRVDAESAAGATAPIDAPLAADGVDEVLRCFLQLDLVDHEVGGAGETIHLHATDADGEWTVRLLDRGIDVERGHAKGDAAVRGSASDLDLWLWGRVPLERLEPFGEIALLQRLRELAFIATQ